MTVNQKLKQGFALQKDDIKGRLLSRSLLWMGFGLAVIVIIAFTSSAVPAFNNVMLKIADNTGFMIMTILNIVLMMAIFFTIRNPKTHILVPTFLYLIFAFYEGIYINLVLNFEGIMDDFSQLLLVMLIPAGIFLLLGFISFFNIFDFTKLAPIATIGFLVLSIMSLVLFFVGGTNNRWFLLLAAAVFVIWIGIDLQLIKNAEDNLQAFGMAQDTKELNRLAFMFGLRLFIDFVNLLWIVIRLMGNNNR